MSIGTTAKRKLVKISLELLHEEIMSLESAYERSCREDMNAKVAMHMRRIKELKKEIIEWVA